MNNTSITLTVNKNGDYQGTITIDDNGDYAYEGISVLRNFITISLKDGIMSLKDIKTNKGYLAIEEKIYPHSSFFALAFKDWLKYNGYEVIQLHPEVDNKIQAFLNKISGHNKEKKRILKQLLHSTFLEKTFLLENIKNNKNCK